MKPIRWGTWKISILIKKPFPKQTWRSVFWSVGQAENFLVPLGWHWEYIKVFIFFTTLYLHSYLKSIKMFTPVVYNIFCSELFSHAYIPLNSFRWITIITLGIHIHLERLRKYLQTFATPATRFRKVSKNNCYSSDLLVSHHTKIMLYCF